MRRNLGITMANGTILLTVGAECGGEQACTAADALHPTNQAGASEECRYWQKGGMSGDARYPF
jgi:hypothetical protein